MTHRPKPESAAQVKAMAAFGIPQEQMAKYLSIDRKTLRKHYRRELDVGMVEANVAVAKHLFKLATSGTNVAAGIFWLKARAGWRERHEVAFTDPDGNPISGMTVPVVFVDGPEREPGEHPADGAA